MWDFLRCVLISKGLIRQMGLECPRGLLCDWRMCSVLSPDGSWCQPCPGAWISILFLGNWGVPAPKCFLLCLGYKSAGNGLRKV